MTKKIELTNEEIQFLETDFKKNKRHGNPAKETHSFIEATSLPNIILTAPHSVKTEKKSIKTGDIIKKDEDLYTGAIVLATQSFLGCHAMVRNNYNDTKIDTNFYNEKLQDYIKKHNIKYLVDIHGAARHLPFDVAPGMGKDEFINYNEIYKTIIVENFHKHNINNIVFGTKFQAMRPTTLCRQVFDGTGIKATQLEINRNYRDPLNDIYKINLLLNALHDYVRNLDEVLSIELESEIKKR